MTRETLPAALGSDLDIPGLERLYDQTKAKVFLGKNASFFGSLLCSMNFYWTADEPTACTDGYVLCWNPYWFLKLKPEVRATVLMHELWHPAALHMIRRGDRHPVVWNVACDHWINNMLKDEGYSFEGTSPCLDPRYRGVLEEEIYEDLIANQGLLFTAWTGQQISKDSQEGDMVIPPGPPTTQEQVNAVGRVVQAEQVAQIAGEDSPLSEAQRTILKQFLNPIVPWDRALHRFMQELAKIQRSWKRPNRRYPDLYLPSTTIHRGALQHLAFIEDVSGSISDSDALRFNSEVRYVKEKYDPGKLTLVQFDDEITQVKVFEKKDPFEQIEIIGRRGTNLEPVRQWIIENRPTAAIIFSDLCCEPMEPLPFDIPVIWVTISNKDAKVNFGEMIHIRG